MQQVDTATSSGPRCTLVYRNTLTVIIWPFAAPALAPAFHRPRSERRSAHEWAAAGQGVVTKMHPIQCKCGAVRGHLEGAGVSSRLICYCTDCRAFARFLGRAADVLDVQGGTEIVQVALPRLRFSQGLDQVAAVRLGEKGAIRWYASCCKTPIGNTMADPKIAFVGLIHSSLDRARMNEDFRTTIALVNTGSALGDPKPRQRGLPGVVARFIWIVLATRISGRYKSSQLFNNSGSPKVVPTVLTPRELARLKSAA